MCYVLCSLCIAFFVCCVSLFLCFLRVCVFVCCVWGSCVLCIVCSSCVPRVPLMFPQCSTCVLPYPPYVSPRVPSCDSPMLPMSLHAPLVVCMVVVVVMCKTEGCYAIGFHVSCQLCSLPCACSWWGFDLLWGGIMQALLRIIWRLWL